MDTRGTRGFSSNVLEDDQTLRHLIPCASVERSARLFLVDTAPLLEEEPNTGVEALISDVTDPLRVHWPGARSGFAAHYYPIDAAQIELGKGPEKRLDGQELQVGMCPSKMINAYRVVFVFDAHTHPDLRFPWQTAAQVQQAVGPFCKHLVLMPVRPAHDLEYVVNIGKGTSA